MTLNEHKIASAIHRACFAYYSNVIGVPDKLPSLFVILEIASRLDPYDIEIANIWSYLKSGRWIRLARRGCVKPP
jgi:hypothetical protein